MRYLPTTAQDQRAMLDTIGARAIEDLLVKIPAKSRLSHPLALPPALAETELISHMRVWHKQFLAGQDEVLAFRLRGQRHPSRIIAPALLG